MIKINNKKYDTLEDAKKEYKEIFDLKIENNIIYFYDDTLSQDQEIYLDSTIEDKKEFIDYYKHIYKEIDLDIEIL